MSSKFQRELFSRSIPGEHGFTPLYIEGELPASLSGTLYRNGPGIFEQFGVKYDHPFEGEGVISAVRIKDGAAAGAVRVVQSPELAEERAQKKILYGGAAPWWRRVKGILTNQMKAPANTNVVPWQGKLLALNEGTGPVELDHELNTLGKTKLGGALSSAFSAHPHRVASRKTLYNIGLEYGPKTRLHFYALPDEGAAKNLGSIPLAQPTLLHDFAMTRDHFVLLVSPVKMNLARVLLQIGGFGDFFSWDPSQGTEIIVAPISNPTEAIRFKVESFFQYHFANAFERDGKLFVDYLRYKDLAPFNEISGQELGGAGGEYHRGVIDLAARTWSSTAVSSVRGEFPRVHPEIEGEEHSVAWLMRGDARALVGLDTKSGKFVEHELPSGQYTTEPIFVPKPGSSGERDGHVLSMCHDEASDRGFLAVYDASRIERGPVSKVWFEHYITATFHGNWLPA